MARIVGREDLERELARRERRRLEQLAMAEEQAMARRRRLPGGLPNLDQARYMMRPTCPPSTQIHVAGGVAGVPGFGYVVTTPDSVFDLADEADTGRAPVFTNAGWYGFYWLSVWSSGDGLQVGGAGAAGWWVERETAADIEAEAMAVDCFQLHSWPPWDFGIVIGCVILKNNGNTTDPNQFLPVYPSNRGECSYIYRNHDSTMPRNVM